jgi:hypothetical protein
MSASSDCCPRCGGGFHCGMNDATSCACMAIALNPETLTSLRQQFAGCLCLACLRELASRASEGLPQRPATLNAQKMQS